MKPVSRTYHGLHDGAIDDCPKCAAARSLAEQENADDLGPEREIGSEPLVADQPGDRELGS